MVERRKSESGRNISPLDIVIGRRLREKRIMLGFSQAKVGSFIGVSGQQVRKYEIGIDRISASTLFVLADVLDVSASYFVEDVIPLERRELSEKPLEA